MNAPLPIPDDIDAWPDPAAWGARLVDVARRLANAYSQQRGLDRQQVLDRIRDAFDAEWSDPLDLPTSSD
ncbi:MAG TPA: DUF5076 domain-containing protein [Kofleriaceae bacterium]|nr:DUF5076 domain-containing protein [Kofleriaceae bacterium]